MHELTLATNLVDLASDHAARHGAAKVTRVTVRLGVLCGMARSLYFCFRPASRGTACADAELRILEVPLTVHCRKCDATKAPRSHYSFRCPDCGFPTPEVISGREMELVSIEISERPPATSLPAEVAQPAMH